MKTKMDKNLLQDITYIIMLVYTISLCPSDLDAQERARPRIENNTLVADTGERLRGGTFWLFGVTVFRSKIDWARSDMPWELLKANGFNAVRLAAGYGELQAPPAGEPCPPISLEEYGDILDELVNRAARYGMYVIIDHHYVGQYHIEDSRAFWNEFAPRYKDRTHVIFELTNEPVKWAPQDYTDQQLRDFEEIWQICHTYAPETPIILLSFAHIGNSGASPLDVARQLQDGDPGEANIINWSKTLIGFHSYWQNTSARIRELKQTFPCINTEFAMPFNHEVKEMDGYEHHGTLMERLEISWIHWNMIDREDKIPNFEAVVQNLTDHNVYWSRLAPPILESTPEISKIDLKPPDPKPDPASISTVPEPTPLFLFGLGLFSLLGLGVRKRNKRKDK
jgi:hypothetical protein